MQQRSAPRRSCRNLEGEEPNYRLSKTTNEGIVINLAGGGDILINRCTFSTSPIKIPSGSGASLEVYLRIKNAWGSHVSVTVILWTSVLKPTYWISGSLFERLGQLVHKHWNCRDIVAVSYFVRKMGGTARDGFATLCMVGISHRSSSR